ncbi:MAG: hypothetical protein IJ801_06045 [Lachnospiraceae bacterium]|nr:hypothetical protein [Lachnospiraceae bacterium]
MKKKRNVKAVLARAAVCSMLFGVVLSVGGYAEAAAPKVDNQNHSIQNAVDINLNTTYAGNCDTYDEQDWYHFVIPDNKKGYFNIVLGPETRTEKYGWTYKVYRKGEPESFYEQEKIKTQSSSINLAFSSGEYYLMICPYGLNMGIYSDENYNFSVKYTEDATWETEANDDQLHANSINLNTEYHGSLYRSEDSDWYVFTLPSDGKVVTTLGANAAEDVTKLNYGWELSLWREGETSAFSSSSGIKTKTTSISYYLRAGTYKMKVSAYVANLAPVYRTYDVSVLYETAANCEAEPNNSPEKANPVTADATYTGNFTYSGDVDCYVFTPSVSGTLNLTFSRDVVADPGDGFTVSISDSAQKVLVEDTRIKEQQISMNPVTVTAGKPYYITVSSSNLFGTDPVLTGVDYHFSFHITSAKEEQQVEAASAIKKDTVTVSSVQSKAKKKVYLKWKKNKYADGYKVYRSTQKKKGYKCIATIKKKSKVSYTDQKVKSGSVYYYKVRAYKKNGKKTVYSGYSPVKRVKVK